MDATAVTSHLVISASSPPEFVSSTAGDGDLILMSSLSGQQTYGHSQLGQYFSKCPVSRLFNIPFKCIVLDFPKDILQQLSGDIIAATVINKLGCKFEYVCGE